MLESSHANGYACRRRLPLDRGARPGRGLGRALRVCGGLDRDLLPALVPLAAASAQPGALLLESVRGGDGRVQGLPPVRAPRKSEPDARRRVREAREYLDRHLDETVTLERLGAAVGLSPYHLQRSFRRQTGMSPKAYADARRMERMKSGLRKGDTVSRATYDAGYTSTSRAYDHARARIGMTPAAYRRGGARSSHPLHYAADVARGSARRLHRPGPLRGYPRRLGEGARGRAPERVSGCPDRSGRRSTPGLDHRRGGPAGRERYGSASAARRAGHSVSDAGLGGVTANPDGEHSFVQRGRARDRAPDRRPGGRRRVRRQPCRGRDTVPSCGSRDRRAGRLSVGTRTEASHPGAGKGALAQGR